MPATLSIVSAPTTVAVGAVFQATFRVTASNAALPSGGSTPVRIGSQSPADNLVWSTNRISLPADVPVYGMVDVVGNFTAPSFAGTYTFAWQLVQEGIAWMGNVVSQNIGVGGASGNGGGTVEDYLPGYPAYNPVPVARADGSLQSFMLLNTNAYLSNGHTHNLTWTNDSGRAVDIYKAYVWTGADRSAAMDIHFEARRASDASYIALMQWDHYADPTLPHGQQFDYAQPLRLDSGEFVNILHMATSLSGVAHAHHCLVLWIK